MVPNFAKRFSFTEICCELKEIQKFETGKCIAGGHTLFTSCNKSMLFVFKNEVILSLQYDESICGFFLNFVYFYRAACLGVIQ